MNNLLPSYFFDLSHYVHKRLFDLDDYVWKALAKLEGYLAELSFERHEATISPFAYLINPETIHLGRGTVVEPGAYIQGPCWIGENCVVRHGAYLRGFVIAGNHCVIGHDTEIIKSILLDHVHAAHFAYLGQAILGNHVNLGAGTKCANLKLNNEPVSILVEKQKISTGLRKLGAIIGDYSQIGCNAVTNPGTLLGKYVHCHPSLNCGGFIPSHQTIMSTANIKIVSREPYGS